MTVKISLFLKNLSKKSISHNISVKPSVLLKYSSLTLISWLSNIQFVESPFSLPVLSKEYLISNPSIFSNGS